VDRQLPIVFIADHGRGSDECARDENEAVDFLGKPFDDNELVKAVALALNKIQAEQNERIEIAEIRRRLLTLTPRECEMLCHVLAGQLDKQAAADLGVVEKTD
jgi:FixJ family two-component response regulator